MGVLDWLTGTGNGAILTRLDKLEANLMAKFENVDRALKAIDTETDRIAAEVRELKETIAQGDLSPEQEQEVQDRLDAVVTRLQGIAKDPENPIPVDEGGSTDASDPTGVGQTENLRNGRNE